MPSAPETIVQIRIAKLQWCQDLSCPIAKHLWLHLKIEYTYIEIVKSFAVAISYTWGEFDRSDVIIGHDVRGNTVSMNLGREWDVQDTINTLARICLENGEIQGYEHAGIWIDQLCIRQTDEKEIRATLASIPTIYRTLDVIALMPGGLCSCLQRVNEKLVVMEPGAKMDSLAELLKAPIGLSGTSDACLNSFGACSYFDRVWTRQELLYSGSIQVMRTNTDELKCVRNEADADDLSDYARQLFKHNQHNPAEGFGAILQATDNFSSSTYDAMEGLKRADTEDEGELYLKHSGCNPLEKMSTWISFLLGRKLVRPDRYGDGPPAKKLHRFLSDLQILGESRRKATKVRDYVTSVWVDCPGYVIPERYKQMCLPSLLEDAVRQLETNYSVSVLTSAVLGFSANSSGDSIIWRPRMHLGRRPIQSAYQIYRGVLSDSPIPLTRDRKAPLRISNPLVTPLSSAARDYTEFFSGWAFDDVLDALKIVVQNWDDGAVGRAVSDDGWLAGLNISDSKYIRLNLLMEPPGKKLLTGRDYEATLARIRLRGDFDHHQVVYEMVALALGMDVRDCHSRGLTLMLVPNKCIGFTSREVGIGVAADERLTIFTGLHGDTALMEAALTAFDTAPTFRPIGLWVPYKGARARDFSACVDINNATGLLE